MDVNIGGELNDHVITIDVDWAPDFAIDLTAEILLRNQVKATWFITHSSPAIERLCEQPNLFEIGIHPNLLPGSSHGKTEDEVLTHVLSFAGPVTAMRTHALCQSSFFLAKAALEYGIRCDFSLFLPRASHLVPHKMWWSGMDLWRFPYFWEDDVEMEANDPIWDASDERLNRPGLKIFDFHPIHVAMNCPTPDAYHNLKTLLPLRDWNMEFVSGHVQGGAGPQTLFRQLAEQLSGKGITARELINKTES